jgi:hypothetical protein
MLANHSRPYHHSGPHDKNPGPSPTGFNSHSQQPLSNDAHSESSRLYHCGQFGLDIDVPLGKDYLHSVGFTNAAVYSGIMRLHRIIHHSWHNSHYYSYGPQKESILKSTAFSTRLLLKKIDAPSVVNWYEHLTSTCEAFYIGLVPSDAIQFKRWQEGLCIPGLGFKRYDDMDSLCTAMPICLAQANSRVQAMIAGVETKTRNGYKIVWNLLYRYVPDFDPTKTVDKPSWDEQGGDVIQYAVAFDLYFQLSAKCGGSHTQFNKSILFLKGITAHHLMKIVEPLIIAIKGMQSNLDDNGGLRIGYLPHHLQVSELAQKIAECCRVEPFDRDLGGRPWINNFMYGDDPSSPANNSDKDTLCYAEPLNVHMQGYLVPTIVQACWPNGQPGRRMPNTTYSRKPDPTPCMHPDQPCIICKACGKKGHSINTCDFLAMSIFLQRYLKNGIATKDTIADAEPCWIDCWKDHGGSPTTMPSKVYQAFAEHSGLTLDQMEAEMDWLCWPATSME